MHARAAVSSRSAGKRSPSRGVTVRSASKVEAICFTSSSKPLKTDSRMIMAATGMATAKTLTPEMMLMTECDFFEKR